MSERQAADFRAGTIASAVANSMGVPRASGGRRAWQAFDFFPSLKPKREEVQSPEEMKAVLQAWAKGVRPSAN